MDGGDAAGSAGAGCGTVALVLATIGWNGLIALGQIGAALSTDCGYRPAPRCGRFMAFNTATMVFAVVSSMCLFVWMLIATNPNRQPKRRWLLPCTAICSAVVSTALAAVVLRA